MKLPKKPPNPITEYINLLILFTAQIMLAACMLIYFGGSLFGFKFSIEQQLNWHHTTLACLAIISTHLLTQRK